MGFSVVRVMEDLLIISKEEKTWSLFAHLSPLLSYIGIPLINIIAPLIIWQIKKDEMSFVAINAKECLNFQISMTIYALICIPLVFVGIGVLLLMVLGVVALILSIIAAIKANNGELYRYPLTIRFVR
ncbi:MAG: DUF4870 domain-containing protein [Opitutales bacterium]